MLTLLKRPNLFTMKRRRFSKSSFHFGWDWGREVSIPKRSQVQRKGFWLKGSVSSPRPHAPAREERRSGSGSRGTWPARGFPLSLALWAEKDGEDLGACLSQSMSSGYGPLDRVCKSHFQAHPLWEGPLQSPGGSLQSDVPCVRAGWG